MGDNMANEGRAATIYWHDYEAFGADARRDRASQFAGIRTDMELNEIDAPLVIYCQPSVDMLPHPQACLITGITPQIARQRGLPEAEFIRQIHAQFTQAKTCVAGYNSIRFDDELTRQLLYRNFYDAYEREWKNGNSRWDMIDVLRLCYALRPDGIVWPKKEDGSVSFRLEELSAANDIAHQDAHDALSDVRATIAMAKLVKLQQPRLFDYAFGLRSKHRVNELLDVAAHTPVLHVSSMYPARLGCLALTMPLAAHPVDSNGVLLYDLRVDPAPWLQMTAQQLRESLFRPRAEMADDQQRLPVKVLHSNRSPMIASPAALEAERGQQLQIDMEQSREHWQTIQAHPDFIKKVVEAFADRPGFVAPVDPDFMLYAGGFFSASDKRLMAKVREMSAQQLADESGQLASQFNDARLPEMLFRYRARNFPPSLSSTEQLRWRQFCQQRLTRSADIPGAGPDLASFDNALADLEQTSSAKVQSPLLQDLQQWRDEVCQL
ncbi:exodeoxyribonuclease I [Pseudohongiella acticola]|jgi:exodeoxyribonuclease I|nr:exodeoxyribonuclease I [Pseudohongiella acticola]